MDLHFRGQATGPSPASTSVGDRLERRLFIAGLAGFGTSIVIAKAFHDCGVLAPMWLVGVMVVSALLVILTL